MIASGEPAINGGTLVVEYLVQAGIKYIFGVPGGQAAPVYAALSKEPRLQYVPMCDERNAVYAADAYARVTGRVAAVDVTAGPGVTKVPSGVAEAYNSSIPVLVMATSVDSRRSHFVGHGRVSQGIDQVSLVRPIVKKAIAVASIDSIPAAFNEVLQASTSGRPGPVFIEIPQDLLAKGIDKVSSYHAVEATFPRSRFVPGGADIRRAREILASSKRPLVIAGGGVLISGAQREVQELAEILDAGVGTSLSGKGAICDTHPLSVGVIGAIGVPTARKVCEEADVILFVGFKFGENSTWSWRFPGREQTVLRLDIDPEQTCPNGAAVDLVGDAREGLRMLIEDLRATPQGSGVARVVWREAISLCRKEWDSLRFQEEGPRHEPIFPQSVVATMSRVAGESDALVCDASFSSGWGGLHFRIRHERQRTVFPRGLAGLGYALPAAIGVALSGKYERVWCLAGDGAFSYSLGELITLRGRGLPVVCVILNNHSYAWIKWWQTLSYGKGVEIADLPHVNFAEIAKAAGLRGVRIDDPDMLEPMLRQVVQSRDPHVIDVSTETMQTPIAAFRKSLARRLTSTDQVAYSGAETGGQGGS